MSHGEFSTVLLFLWCNEKHIDVSVYGKHAFIKQTYSGMHDRRQRIMYIVYTGVIYGDMGWFLWFPPVGLCAPHFRGLSAKRTKSVVCAKFRQQFVRMSQNLQNSIFTGIPPCTLPMATHDIFNTSGWIYRADFEA